MLRQIPGILLKAEQPPDWIAGDEKPTYNLDSLAYAYWLNGYIPVHDSLGNCKAGIRVSGAAR
jgi:hypothetical protein